MNDFAQEQETLGRLDVHPLIDPELAPILGSFEMPPINAEGLAALRGGAFPAPVVSDAVVRTEYLVPSDPPVPVRVHRPADNDGVLPAIFSIHGGGYILGSYLMDDFLHDEWSPELGTAGVSV